jgi:transposase-like protein
VANGGEFLLKMCDQPPECKLCGSQKVVKFGYYHTIQRWWCNDCHRKFADNRALPGMKIPRDLVAQALDLYFQGVRLIQIPEMIFRRSAIAVNYASVFHWVEQFCQTTTQDLSKACPVAGTRLIFNEIPLKLHLELRRTTIRDVVDTETHYLMASKIVYAGLYDEYREFMATTAGEVSRQPQYLLVTRNWPDSTDNENSDQEFVRNWQRTANPRTRILQSLKKPEKTQIILDGWRVHYNFFTRQESLSGKTPAEAAQIAGGMGSWPFQPKLNKNLTTL